MSLDWITKECKGNEVTSGWIPVPADELTPGVVKERHMHPDTNSLVWGAFCGFHVPRITPKNIDEVIWRIEFLKLVDRPWMTDRTFPTIEAIQEHVGLWTNCDGKTRKQWLAFVTASLSREVSSSIERMYTSGKCVDVVNI